MESNVDLLKKEIKEKFPHSKYLVPLLEKNLCENKYRGRHSIQHERKSLMQLIILLKAFKKNSNSNGEMLITSGDDRPEINGDADPNINYLNFVNEINNNIEYVGERQGNSAFRDQFKTLKKQTLKNLFDIGIFEKYGITKSGKIKHFSPGESAKGVADTYLKMEKTILEKLDSSDMEIETFLSRKIKMFFLDNTEILMKIFTDEEIIKRKITSISNEEYTLTLGYFGESNCYDIKNNYFEVKKAFIELNTNEQMKRMIISLFKKYSENTKQEEKNNGQIDWGNFKNHTQSLFSYLSMTSTFELKDNKIIFTLKNYSSKNKEAMPKRSIEEKNKYFKENNFDKKDYPIFELHHIFPLAYAETAEEFKLIDDWRNLIYISPNKHAEFPKRNNNYTLIKEANKDEMLICSILDNKDYKSFSNTKDVYYNFELLDKILNYNKMLNKIE